MAVLTQRQTANNNIWASGYRNCFSISCSRLWAQQLLTNGKGSTFGNMPLLPNYCWTSCSNFVPQLWPMAKSTTCPRCPTTAESVCIYFLTQLCQLKCWQNGTARYATQTKLQYITAGVTWQVVVLAAAKSNSPCLGKVSSTHVCDTFNEAPHHNRCNTW